MRNTANNPCECQTRISGLRQRGQTSVPYNLVKFVSALVEWASMHVSTRNPLTFFLVVSSFYWVGPSECNRA